ncbi:MAG: polymer-forming cytoskeletal protein [Nitrospirales bacterium]|nr:polymer-forming cytoskeletal protein [Nitrospira sp.]MDR4501405.1 polymer-forming cytoskeletal protein [Nitrospirales bacterium]
MATVSELEAPTQSSTSYKPLESQKTFQVPTQPVDGKGEVVAFIGPGVEFKGEIFYEGSVQIDGTLDGQIHTNGTLLIGEQAVISAKVNAGSVISKGKVNGDIVANKQVQLLSTAIMDGSLTTPELSMEIGVVFNGDISMRTGANAANDNSSFKYKDHSPYQKSNGNTSNMKKDKGPETSGLSSKSSETTSNGDKHTANGSSVKSDSNQSSK